MSGGDYRSSSKHIYLSLFFLCTLLTIVNLYINSGEILRSIYSGNIMNLVYNTYQVLGYMGVILLLTYAYIKEYYGRNIIEIYYTSITILVIFLLLVSLFLYTQPIKSL